MVAALQQLCMTRSLDLGIGFVPDMGGQSTGMVATLDLSCSGIEDVTSVRISGPWWGWDPMGRPRSI